MPPFEGVGQTKSLILFDLPTQAGLVDMFEKHATKGRLVYVAGKLQTRRYRKNGEDMDRFSKEILLVPGGKVQFLDKPAGIWTALDRARAKYPDMVLVHGGGPGVEKIGASWADARSVHQVVCRPNWDAHGKAAPFRRNDDIINLLPRGIIAFPGSGITANLVDKARQAGIPVMQIAA